MSFGKVSESKLTRNSSLIDTFPRINNRHSYVRVMNIKFPRSSKTILILERVNYVLQYPVCSLHRVKEYSKSVKMENNLRPERLYALITVHRPMYAKRSRNEGDFLAEFMPRRKLKVHTMPTKET